MVPPICQAILLLGACAVLKTHRCRFIAVRGSAGAIRQIGRDGANDKFVAVENCHVHIYTPHSPETDTEVLLKLPTSGMQGSIWGIPIRLCC